MLFWDWVGDFQVLHVTYWAGLLEVEWLVKILFHFEFI